MKIFDKEFPDLPGMGKSKWQELTISAAVTREQLQDFEALGVDGMGMIESVLRNESYQSLGKLISKAVFTPRPQEIKWQKTAYWLEGLLENKKGDNKFILTNLHVGAAFMEASSDFVSKPFDSNSAMGNIYNIGKIFDTPIYVDPNMLYGNTELAIVSGNVLQFKEIENIRIVTEGHAAPKIVATLKYKLQRPNSDVYKIINLDF